MSLDVIIVGAGMGGAAMAWALTQKGYKVLLLEKGLAKGSWLSEHSADYAERFCPDLESRSKAFPRMARNTIKVNNWTPVLGSGEGGGSSVYGGVLLRFYPHDLARWPWDYKALVPFYEQAERLLQPCGEDDPILTMNRFLIDPAPLSETAIELREYLTKKGLHPFCSPVGYRPSKQCRQCFGSFCVHECKRTASNSFLDKAKASGTLELKFGVTVEQINSDAKHITSLTVRNSQGQLEVISAKKYVLAAGALATPVLLLKSKNQFWPNGIGNKNDLVGRYFMRHLIDFYYVKTNNSKGIRGHLNELTVSDLQLPDRGGLGLLAYVPSLMEPDLMAQEVVYRLKEQKRIPVPPGLFKWILKKIIEMKTKDRVLLTAILEDEPSYDNRINWHDQNCKINLSYKISKSDQERLKKSRRFWHQCLEELCPNLLPVAEDNSFLAHGCGSARMAFVPELGVANPSGKVFGIENLYIADASLFPTSGGVNPALTVAACSLKVACDLMRERQIPL